MSNIPRDFDTVVGLSSLHERSIVGAGFTPTLERTAVLWDN